MDHEIGLWMIQDNCDPTTTMKSKDKSEVSHQVIFEEEMCYHDVQTNLGYPTFKTQRKTRMSDSIHKLFFSEKNTKSCRQRCFDFTSSILEQSHMCQLHLERPFGHIHSLPIEILTLRLFHMPKDDTGDSQTGEKAI
jgi:hypothetical protein